MPPVMRQQFSALLEPILSDVMNDQRFPRRETIYTSLYDLVKNEGKATITVYERAGIGDFQVKNEGGPITFSDPITGNSITFSPVRYGNGYQITQEMLDHDQYDEMRGMEMDLQIAGQEHLEVEGHRLLNGGFGTTNVNGYRATGFDGLALFSTAHTRLDGGAVIRNRPSTDVDLGVTGLQNALIDFDNMIDDRGRPVFIRPKLLVINPEDRFTAKELLESEYKPGVANNEINALKDAGLSFMVSHYLTDNDAWFVIGDQHDMNFIWDERPRGGMEEDFDAEVIKRKVVEGFGVGHGEFRGTWGTSG